MAASASCRQDLSPHSVLELVGRQAMDTGVGFGSAPAAAKLEHAERTIGESTVHGAWRYQGSRPVVWNGRLFSTAGDVLTATDLDANHEVWRWSPDAENETGDRFLSPPAVTNGRVYAGTRDGRVLSWNAISGELRWSVQVGASAAWQPAVSGSAVYAGLGSGQIVSFATGDPLDDGWPMWGGGPGHNGA